uniref:Putative secreted protein n=1 Tax=Amblyomma triste TaxID=251400 RepID=A0A023G5H7_AMBTT
MNFGLALFVSVIAAATAVHFPPNPDHIPRPSPPFPSFPIIDPNPQDLDISRVVNVNERLVVIMRKHTIETNYRCLSALKKGGSIPGSYQYNLRARNGIHIEDSYENFNVQVMLEPLGGTAHGYKATYTQKDKKITLTLKKVDMQEKCFVLFADHGNNQGGCELLLRKSALNMEIPKDCLSYYENQCGGVSIQLHEEGCKYDDVTEFVPLERGQEPML